MRIKSRALGTYTNNNYTNVIKEVYEDDIEFKTEYTKNT